MTIQLKGNDDSTFANDVTSAGQIISGDSPFDATSNEKGAALDPYGVCYVGSTGTNNVFIGRDTGSGADNITLKADGTSNFAGIISAYGLRTDGYFTVGVDYPFGDYDDISKTRNPAAMLVMTAGNDYTGATKCALYLVSVSVVGGVSSTHSFKLAGDSDISMTFTDVGTTLRIENTSTASAYSWRYLGGYL